MIVRQFLTTLAASILFLIPAVAHARSPMTMALAWSPTSELDDAGEVDLTGIGSLKLEIHVLADERADHGRIGENRENELKIFPVSTRDDVPLFVTRGLRDVLNRFGLRVVEANGDVVLSGSVRRFFVTESSTYQGEVALWITAKDKAGRLIWEGVVNGTATRWGREYKAANYCEVLSDSVFDATAQLLRNSSLRNALRTASSSPLLPSL